MNGQTEVRLYIDLMNSETGIGDYVGKQLAQRLPALLPARRSRHPWPKLRRDFA